jgi:hypothetical protein
MSKLRTTLTHRVLRRLTAAAAGVFTLAAGRGASAITIRSDTSNSLYTALSAESQYAPVGYIDALLSNEEVFGSGVLIAPDWVLTAGHVASYDETGPPDSPSELSFGMGASTTPFTQAPDSVSQVDVEPAYTSNPTDGPIDGVDLALIQLSTPITNVTPAVLYSSSMGSEIGLTATVVGYGLSGTGTTGDSLSAGTRRAMQDVIDAFGGQEVVGGTPQHPTYNSLSAYSSNLLFTQFESPVASQQQFTNIMGGTSAVPLQYAGAVAPGDSGGGLFVTVNGITYLTAEVDFAANPYTSPTGKYGDYDGYTRLDVPTSVNFLDSILVTSSNWDLPGSGTWASQGSWTGSNIPEYMQSTANFGAGIAGAAQVTLDCDWTVGTVTFNNTNSYTLSAGNGGSLTLDNGGITATAAVIDNGGSHFITAPIALNSNALFNVVNSGDVLTISGQFSGSGGVTIGGAGTVRLAAGGGTTTLTALAIQTGATLDITNNTVEINYGSPANTPVAAIAAALARGYAGGSWTGTGINSSTAAAGSGGTEVFSIGYADGNVDADTAAAANQVVIKFTLAGDALLNGIVNFNDLLVVGQHLNTTGNDWAEGNFTYDPAGAVTFNDLDIVGQNLNQSLALDEGVQEGGSTIPLGLSASIATGETSAALPDPGVATLALLVAGTLLRRRRRALHRGMGMVKEDR